MFMFKQMMHVNSLLYKKMFQSHSRDAKNYMVPTTRRFIGIVLYPLMTLALGILSKQFPIPIKAGSLFKAWVTGVTFHFPFGEMTVTPLDFVAIASLFFGGKRLLYHPDFYQSQEKLDKGEGFYQTTTHSDRYPYSHLYTRFSTTPCDTSAEINIMTRLLYLLGTCIFTSFGLLKSLFSSIGVVQPWPQYMDTWVQFHAAP